MDIGGMRNKYVGESEATIRRCFQTIEALGRAVVWIDEIEKAMAGATQGAADGGVSGDALGAILNWMQERKSEAFVIATANSIEDLPPELLRKGRFDEIWFVDLPNPSERTAVLAAALKANGRSIEGINLDEVSSRCIDFTGAEIAALVPDALFAGFNDGARPITTADLTAAAATIIPLAKTAADKIEKLRTWAKGRARPASAPFTAAPASRTSQLDL
jgi:SpoVK/Ycf46/Vps4 family AAA+-type ATPase